MPWACSCRNRKRGQNPVRGSLDSSINGNDLYSLEPTDPAQIFRRCPCGDGSSNGRRECRPAWTILSRPQDWRHATSLPCPTGVIPRSPTCRRSRRRSGRSRPRSSWRSCRIAFKHFSSATASTPVPSIPSLPPLAFQVTPDRHVKVLFCDVDRRFYEATALAVTVAEEPLVPRGRHAATARRCGCTSTLWTARATACGQ